MSTQTKHEMLVDTNWIEQRLNDSKLRLIDVTTYLQISSEGFKLSSGRQTYEAAHLPGATFLDILSELSDPEAELRFTRASVPQLEKVLSSAGINLEHQIVIYSASEVMWATRAWWLLRSVGLNASILDGGFEKWRSEGRCVCSEPCSYPPTHFVAKPMHEAWSSTQEVLAAIGDGEICTINALSAHLHSGSASLGYARDGHIRGSVNLPSRELLQTGTNLFREPDDLRSHFEATDVLNKSHVIAYCGGGISATVNAFALLLAGHNSVSVYDGSLDEWSRNKDLPMERGE